MYAMFFAYFFGYPRAPCSNNTPPRSALNTLKKFQLTNTHKPPKLLAPHARKNGKQLAKLSANYLPGRLSGY